MKKKVYIRPVSVALSEEMFNQMKTIVDNENIGFSDYTREAIREKLNRAIINKNKKEE